MDVAETQGQALGRIMAELGTLWGLGRPVKCHELGRALRCSPSDPGRVVRAWRSEGATMPAVATVALEMMANGAFPPDGLAAVIGNKRRKVRA